MAAVLVESNASARVVIVRVLGRSEQLSVTTISISTNYNHHEHRDRRDHAGQQTIRQGVSSKVSSIYSGRYPGVPNLVVLVILGLVSWYQTWLFWSYVLGLVPGCQIWSFWSCSGLVPGYQTWCLGHTRVGNRVPNLVFVVILVILGLVPGCQIWLFWSYVLGLVTGYQTCFCCHIRVGTRVPKPDCLGHTRVGTPVPKPGCFGHMYSGW